jgi:hypothetical protein
MGGYKFEHRGKAYDADGPAVPSSQLDVTEHNRETERAEIAWLQTAPDAVLLYIGQGILQTCCRTADTLNWLTCPICHTAREDMARGWRVQTWLGTVIGTHVTMGPRRTMFRAVHTYRRPMTCRLYGVQYHGWYYESSGDYCRLRKSKRQT